MDTSARHILLTGATGFLGRHLLSRLVGAGYRVRALYRSDTPPAIAAATSVEWVRGDLLAIETLEEALTDIDTVVHAAALVSYRSADRDALFLTNETGTANLVNAALFRGVSRFIHVGSTATLERDVKGPISAEQYWPQTQPLTAYGQSKFQAQREVWRGRAEGLSIATVFPGILLGGGEAKPDGQAPPTANPRLALLRQMAERFPQLYPPGANGFVAAADVAEAIRLLLERDRNGDRFLLSAANWSYRELLATFAKAAGRPAPQRALSPRILRWLGRWERWRGTAAAELLSPDAIRLANTTLQYDGSRATRELGLQYTDPATLLLT